MTKKRIFRHSSIEKKHHRKFPKPRRNESALPSEEPNPERLVVGNTPERKLAAAAGAEGKEADDLVGVAAIAPPEAPMIPAHGDPQVADGLRQGPFTKKIPPLKMLGQK